MLQLLLLIIVNYKNAYFLFKKIIITKGCKHFTILNKQTEKVLQNKLLLEIVGWYTE